MMHGRIPAAPQPESASRYQGRQGIDPVATMLVAAITVPLLALAFIYKAYVEPARLDPKMTVHNVELIPPSAPPPPDTPPPPAKVPPPILPPVSKAPTMQVTPDRDPTPSPPAPPAPAKPPAPPEPPAPPAPPATVAAGDISATMIHAPPPRYPQESRRLREQGTVVLTVLLDVDGRVADIGIAQSSGHRRLDTAALAAVRKWRWRPTVRQGVAVQVRGSVEIPFQLIG